MLWAIGLICMGIVFDSCKTALSWVVVWISVVLRRLWLFLSVTG